MTDALTSERTDAIPITPVTREQLPSWLDTHSSTRGWIAAIGFKAEPGTFAFLAGDDGRPAKVLAAPADGESVWAFAGLPLSLPEGRYAFDS